MWCWNDKFVSKAWSPLVIPCSIRESDPGQLTSKSRGFAVTSLEAGERNRASVMREGWSKTDYLEKFCKPCVLISRISALRAKTELSQGWKEFELWRSEYKHKHQWMNVKPTNKSGQMQEHRGEMSLFVAIKLHGTTQSIFNWRKKWQWNAYFIRKKLLQRNPKAILI